jgi:hypothetical protein
MRGKSILGALLLATALLALSACHKATSDEEAIRASILRHLRENSSINLANMDTTVQQVSINGDRAQAQVLFRTKQEGQSMVMTYALERSGGEWKVLRGQPSGGQVAHPPMDGQHPPPGSQANPATPGNPQLHWPSDGFGKDAKPQQPSPAPAQPKSTSP